MSAVHVRRLEALDLRDGFDAGPKPGEAALTTFFRQYALQHQRRRLSATWVAMDDAAISGYVTLCPGAVSADDAHSAGAKVGGQPVPVLLLARMATASDYRKRGVGRLLIEQAVMPQAERLATEYGCIGVYADGKCDSLGFYEKHGFIALDRQDHGTTPMLRLLARR